VLVLGIAASFSWMILRNPLVASKPYGNR
jgi:hypothetical protein